MTREKSLLKETVLTRLGGLCLSEGCGCLTAILIPLSLLGWGLLYDAGGGNSLPLLVLWSVGGVAAVSLLLYRLVEAIEGRVLTKKIYNLTAELEWYGLNLNLSPKGWLRPEMRGESLCEDPLSFGLGVDNLRYLADTLQSVVDRFRQDSSAAGEYLWQVGSLHRGNLRVVFPTHSHALLRFPDLPLEVSYIPLRAFTHRIHSWEELEEWVEWMKSDWRLKGDEE